MSAGQADLKRMEGRERTQLIGKQEQELDWLKDQMVSMSSEAGGGSRGQEEECG